MTNETQGNPGSTLTDLGRVGAACNRFEADWRAGRAPRVDDYVADMPEPERDILKSELLALEAELKREDWSWPDATWAHEPPVRVESPGAETTSPATGPVDGPRLGRYRDLAEIGRGGMGAVHRVRDLTLHRDLALKVLSRPGSSGQAEVEHRFVEEAQVVGQLQHPGIPPLHELGRLPDGRPYFTMKLIKGRTLRELLKERPTPDADLSRFVAVFEQIAQTIAYAHSKRVLHRDLKPSNVMVGAFGEVQVMDWGLAKVLKPGEGRGTSPTTAETSPSDGLSVIRTVRAEVTDAHTQAGSLLGTPDYIAPEQARGEVDDVDERSDVFGLGAILCEILTGRPPYVGRSSDEVLRKAARADLADALARLEDCGADVELIVLARACLAPDPLDRPRDAARVTKAISDYRAGVVERLRRAERARVEAESHARALHIINLERDRWAELAEVAEQARAEQERQVRILTKAHGSLERQVRWLAAALTVTLPVLVLLTLATVALGPTHMALGVTVLFLTVALYTLLVLAGLTGLTWSLIDWTAQRNRNRAARVANGLERDRRAEHERQARILTEAQSSQERQARRIERDRRAELADVTEQARFEQERQIRILTKANTALERQAHQGAATLAVMLLALAALTLVTLYLVLEPMALPVTLWDMAFAFPFMLLGLAALTSGTWCLIVLTDQRNRDRAARVPNGLERDRRAKQERQARILTEAQSSQERQARRRDTALAVAFLAMEALTLVTFYLVQGPSALAVTLLILAAVLAVTMLVLAAVWFKSE